MGIFRKKSGKEPDLDNREEGYGVIEVYPFLFVKADTFFKELKEEFLEYLTDEEQEALIEHFTMERRSFRVFVPEKEYRHIEKKMSDVTEKWGSAFKTFVPRVLGDTSYRCGCGRWSSGCCGGPVMDPGTAEAYARGRLQKDDPRLKEYFILSHVDKVRNEWQREHAQVNAYQALTEW